LSSADKVSAALTNSSTLPETEVRAYRVDLHSPVRSFPRPHNMPSLHCPPSSPSSVESHAPPPVIFPCGTLPSEALRVVLTHQLA
jgi:hypothetical protein